VIYLDTSVALAELLAEDRRARPTLWEEPLVSSRLLEYELWSPDWEAKVKASKFGVWPNYGRAKRGHIAIQGDHEGALAFRNIRIREVR